MKRFVFKLENVLKYRETLESLAKNAYREALQQLNIERNKLLELQKMQESLKAAYNLEPGTVIDPDILIFASTYASQLMFLIREQKMVIEEQENVVKEKFEEWNEKRKDVKVIKRLEEKKWREYLREMDKEEQKFQDEVFIAKKIREKKR